MNIKSQKDFFSGLMFMVVGVAFAWGASGYTIGNGARMGPGYFPLVLGVLLALLGAVITFKSMVVETVDGDKVGAFAWKPLIFRTSWRSFWLKPATSSHEWASSLGRAACGGRAVGSSTHPKGIKSRSRLR